VFSVKKLFSNPNDGEKETWFLPVIASRAIAKARIAVLEAPILRATVTIASD
jgi:hypothetical protein